MKKRLVSIILTLTLIVSSSVAIFGDESGKDPLRAPICEDIICECED